MSGFACRGCGVALPPKPRPQGRRREWCSEACRVRLVRKQAGQFVREFAEPRTCVHCGGEFRPKHPKSLYCSKPCGYRHRSILKPKNPDWAQGRRTPRPLPCLACGVPVMAKGSKALCDACRTERRGDRRRRNNVARRGAAVLVRYTLNEIGERDGWTCHLCRRRVDRTLAGSRPLGPTIDHLVPVADGGTDEPANVALAHRVCNTRRGVRGTVQLRLTG